MRTGYLFGVIPVIHDTHRDETFIEQNGIIIIRNGHQLLDYNELIHVARELGVKPYKMTLIGM